MEIISCRLLKCSSSRRPNKMSVINAPEFIKTNDKILMIRIIIVINTDDQNNNNKSMCSYLFGSFK